MSRTTMGTWAREPGAPETGVAWLIGVARHKLADHWRRLEREERGLRLVENATEFLDPMVSTCERCDGRRFTDKALRHTYKGTDVGTVFRMSVNEAQDDLFQGDRLTRLADVGLGYLILGPACTPPTSTNS